MAGAAPNVYVSFAVEDEKRVIPLLLALEQDGIVLRLPGEVSDGSGMVGGFRALVDEADAVLVPWTERTGKARGVRQDAAQAAELGKLVPVRLDGPDVIPSEFQHLATIDLSSWDGSPADPRFHQLRQTVDRLASQGLGSRDLELHETSSEPEPTESSTSSAEPELTGFDLTGLAVIALAESLRRTGTLPELHMEHLVEALYREGSAKQAIQRAGIDHRELEDIIRITAKASFPRTVEPTMVDRLPRLSLHVTEALSAAQHRAATDGRAVSGADLLAGALSVERCGLIAPLLARGVRADARDDGPRQHVRWVADEPVSLDGDTLRRRGVARTLEDQLRELIEFLPGRSFLVHVDGPWGAGKSTLLRFLADLVQERGLTGQQRPWLTVDYDAWRQSRVGPPWLTLLQAVRSAVRADQGSWWRRVRFWIHERVRLVSAWQWVAFATLALVVVALIVLVGAALRGSASLMRWGDLVKLVGGLFPIVAAAWLLFGYMGRFLFLDSRRSARAFVENRADPMEDLADHFRWILRQAGRPVLLLVDDLDRCPESFVVELLDAVQKLMRDPLPARVRRLGSGAARQEDGPTLMVVVAADGRWIRQAYDNAFASLEVAVREPGATIGSLFLEKLFQLTLPVPRLPDALKRDYLTALLNQDGASAGSGQPEELAHNLSVAPRQEVLDLFSKASPVERLEVADVVIRRLVVEQGARQQTEHALQPYSPLLEPTPRAMKRFVMAYSVLRAVRTAEGSAVGVGPLALWTIVVTRWPLLAQFLQENPAAVRLFTESADRVASAVPSELVPLFADPPDDLRAVMNHPSGPLTCDMIRECCGQSVLS